MQKLKEQSGETIIETLVSMLIAVICISMLATSMLAAARINEKVRRKLTEELSFQYSKPAVERPELCAYLYRCFGRVQAGGYHAVSERK